MPLPSIRRRLSLALMSISLAWGIAVSAAVWVSVNSEVDDLLDNALQESAEIIFGLLSFNAAQLPMTNGGSMPAPTHDEQVVWQVVDADEHVLLRSHHAPDQALQRSHASGLSSVGREWRVYTMAFDGTGRFLHVAQRGSARRQAGFDAALLAAGAALVVGSLCAYWLRASVRRELAPITRMSQALARFDPLHPDSPLEPVDRAELVPMHAAVRELGERLARRLANERAFSAHAAHALRTPLAGLVMQLAVAQRLSPQSAQPPLSMARTAAERLSAVVAALLTLFRTGSDLKWRTVDVEELVGHLPFETLRIEVVGRSPIQADPDLLAAVMMNLFDNSRAHGARSVLVEVSVVEHGALLILRDDGEGMAEPERLRLEQALETKTYEREMGLGLMLADLVARAHGGRLRSMPSATGFVVAIELGTP